MSVIITDATTLTDLRAGAQVCIGAPDAQTLESLVNAYLEDRRSNLVDPDNYAIRDFKVAGAGDGGIFQCQLLLANTGTPVLPGTNGELPLVTEQGMASVVFVGSPNAGPPSADATNAPSATLPQVAYGLNEQLRRRYQDLALAQSGVDVYFTDVAGCGRGRKFVVGAALFLTAPEA